MKHCGNVLQSVVEASAARYLFPVLSFASAYRNTKPKTVSAGVSTVLVGREAITLEGIDVDDRVRYFERLEQPKYRPAELAILQRPAMKPPPQAVESDATHAPTNEMPERREK